ncbi:MAG: cytochrome c oxidase subunit II [Pyrinomonadaceae bacterium]|nr:cytochrome c oxidase subunit II [Pyrinomonadaceae bacterium]
MGRVLAALIWLVTLLTVILFVSKRWWFPENIAAHGAAIDRQFAITLTVVAFAFVAAQIGLGYTIWKYRATPEDKKARATYSHGNNRLEVIWTGITAIIFIGLAIMGQRVWAALYFEKAPSESYEIHVVAQQFQWNFQYPGKDKLFGRTDPKLINDGSQNFVGLDDTDPNSKDDIVAPTLVIPLNKPVRLLLRARDVTHSLWIPNMRYKQDAVPGMEIPVHFMATKEGLYEIACAELCGQLHYKMGAKMLVLPEAEHQALVSLSQPEFQKKRDEYLAKYEGK